MHSGNEVNQPSSVIIREFSRKKKQHTMNLDKLLVICIAVICDKITKAENIIR